MVGVLSDYFLKHMQVTYSERYYRNESFLGVIPKIDVVGIQISKCSLLSQKTLKKIGVGGRSGRGIKQQLSRVKKRHGTLESGLPTEDSHGKVY